MSDLNYPLLLGKKNGHSDEVNFTWISRENLQQVQDILSQLVPDLIWQESQNFAKEALIENEYGIYEITLIKNDDLQSRVDVQVAEEPAPVLSGILKEFVLFDTVKKRFLNEDDLTFEYFNS